MIRDHGLRLLAGVVEASFGRHLRQEFAVLIYVQQFILAVVIRIRVLGVTKTDQAIRPERHRIMKSHLLLIRLIEGGPREPDKYDHDADVDQVAAVSTSIAAG